MFCDNCGEKIETGGIFCDKCGHSIVSTNVSQPIPTHPKQKNVSYRAISGFNPHAVYAGVVLVIVLVAGYYFNASLANQQQKVERIAQLASTSVQAANDKLTQVQNDLEAAKTQIKNTPTPTITPTPAASTKLTNSQIIAKTKPAVVYIETSEKKGSGMIISSDGYVLTNAHVIEGASSATVTLSSGASYFAIITGRNEDLDVAVLKIGATSLPAITLGNSEDVGPGDNVFALGFPFGLKGDVSFTAGVISRRLTATGYSYFESTAEIHPGNSGGPLVNSNGQVIGINTLTYGNSIQGVQLGETIKLAIPINIAKSQLASLKSGASVVTPTYTPPATSPQPTYTPPPPDDQAIGEDYYRTKHTCVGLSGKQYEFCLTYAYNH